MSAHVDKTSHRKIYDINDTGTFPPYPFFKNVIFAHKLVHEFMCEFAREFVKDFFMNFVHKFKYKIQTNSRKVGYVTNGLYCITLYDYLYNYCLTKS